MAERAIIRKFTREPKREERLAVVNFTTETVSVMGGQSPATVMVAGEIYNESNACVRFDTKRRVMKMLKEAPTSLMQLSENDGATLLEEAQTLCESQGIESKQAFKTVFEALVGPMGSPASKAKNEQINKALRKALARKGVKNIPDDATNDQLRALLHSSTAVSQLVAIDPARVEALRRGEATAIARTLATESDADANGASVDSQVEALRATLDGLSPDKQVWKDEDSVQQLTNKVKHWQERAAQKAADRPTRKAG